MPKILFVDDEDHILTLKKLILSHLGDEVLFVNSGQDAIDAMSNPDIANDIKLLLLDLTMPVIDGIDVLKWMKNNNIKITTILQTGIKDQDVIDEANALDISGILDKPYSNKELLDCIKKYTKL